MFWVVISPKLRFGLLLLLFYRHKVSGEFPATTLPSFCPLPLVKAPHPVPPVTRTHTHTPAVGILPLSELRPLIQLLTCTGDTVNPFLFLSLSLGLPCLAVCLLVCFSSSSGSQTTSRKTLLTFVKKVRPIDKNWDGKIQINLRLCEQWNVNLKVARVRFYGNTNGVFCQQSLLTVLCL